VFLEVPEAKIVAPRDADIVTCSIRFASRNWRSSDREFRDHKQHGLSEISHAGSFDESGISILPPVLLEHISEK